MILVDDDFATIVAAVEEGRGIFSNIRKFLRFLPSSNIGEVLTMLFGVILGARVGLVPEEGKAVVLPLLATQIRWSDLVTDGAPALALGVVPAAAGRRGGTHGAHVARHRARPRGDGGGHALRARRVAPGGSMPFALTMASTTLMFFHLWSDERSALRDPFHNPWLWSSVGPSVVLQALVVYLPLLQRAFGTVPLAWDDWLRCVAVASAVLWVRELSKIVTRAADARAATARAARN